MGPEGQPPLKQHALEEARRLINSAVEVQDRVALRREHVYNLNRSKSNAQEINEALNDVILRGKIEDADAIYHFRFIVVNAGGTKKVGYDRLDVLYGPDRRSWIIILFGRKNFMRVVYWERPRKFGPGKEVYINEMDNYGVAFGQDQY